MKEGVHIEKGRDRDNRNDTDGKTDIRSDGQTEDIQEEVGILCSRRSSEV